MNDNINNVSDKELRERVKILLENKKFNPTSFSEAIGVLQQTFNRQIKGQGAISIDTVSAILSTFPDISAEWLLRGTGTMYRNGSGGEVVQEGEADERVPEKEVLLVPAGARGGSLDHFEEEVGLNAYNAEVIRSPFINADLAMMLKNESMAPEYPAGTYLFLKRLSTSVIEWGQCYALDTLDGVKFYCIQPSELGSDYLRCLPLNQCGRYAAFDVPKTDVTGVYKTLGAMKW